MNQFLIGLIVVLGLSTYWLYSQNQVLSANNAKLEGAIATQEEAIASLQSQAAQRELNRYTQFIQNYQLTAKILENPVEMQRKINNGTKHIMEDIEKLSDTIDNLDDGLQLQPSSN